MSTSQAEHDEVAQDSFPDDPDQGPRFDPAEPESIPDHASGGARDFDQSSGA